MQTGRYVGVSQSTLLPSITIHAVDLGSAAFIGLGAYSYFSGLHHLEKNQASILKSGSRFGMQSRRTGLAGIALALAGMGFYRLKN